MMEQLEIQISISLILKETVQQTPVVRDSSHQATTSGQQKPTAPSQEGYIEFKKSHNYFF